MKNSTLWCMFVYMLLAAACSPTSQVSKNYTFEDKQVFELVDKLKKNPNDASALEMLPQAYKQALATRQAINQSNSNNLTGGDRHMAMAKDLLVIQNMYQAIVSTPAAYAVVPSPLNASAQIQNQYDLAAKAYYNQGMVYMSHNTRQYAQMAYDAFTKANTAVPGYQDVAQMMNNAIEMSIVHVIVKPVNYYNNSYNYWGFQNDFLQDQMVSDLNFRAYRDVKFYTQRQASLQNIYPDKIVDLDFTNIFISQLFNRSNTYRRSAKVQTGSTKSLPPQPVYKTVYAVVYITERYMQGNASLQCRIFDVATNRNMMYDNFPGNYNWKYLTGRYTGDRRALTPEDIQIINNGNFINPPARNEIANQLLRNCYNSLLNRINSSIQFTSN